MKRLNGSWLVFNQIKHMLLNHHTCGFVFTGLPHWATPDAFQDIKMQLTKIEKKRFVNHYKNSTVHTKSLLSGLSKISHGIASINSKTDLTYYIGNPLVSPLKVHLHKKI